MKKMSCSKLNLWQRRNWRLSMKSKEIF